MSALLFSRSFNVRFILCFFRSFEYSLQCNRRCFTDKETLHRLQVFIFSLSRKYWCVSGEPCWEFIEYYFLFWKYNSASLGACVFTRCFVNDFEILIFFSCFCECVISWLISCKLFVYLFMDAGYFLDRLVNFCKYFFIWSDCIVFCALIGFLEIGFFLLKFWVFVTYADFMCLIVCWINKLCYIWHVLLIVSSFFSILYFAEP